ncbi:MAG: hypothetical protein R3C68_16125 [Myxococcota bacterium]
MVASVVGGTFLTKSELLYRIITDSPRVHLTPSHLTALDAVLAKGYTFYKQRYIFAYAQLKPHLLSEAILSNARHRRRCFTAF